MFTARYEKTKLILTYRGIEDTVTLYLLNKDLRIKETVRHRIGLCYSGAKT